MNPETYTFTVYRPSISAPYAKNHPEVGTYCAPSPEEAVQYAVEDRVKNPGRSVTGQYVAIQHRCAALDQAYIVQVKVAPPTPRFTYEVIV